MKSPHADSERRIEVPPLTFRADVVPKSLDEEARTVELVFSTGAAVERMDWFTGRRYLEKLSLDPAHVRIDRLNNGGPLLDAHSAWSVTSVLGVVEPGSVRIQKKQGRAVVRFSSRADVDPIWQDVRGGIIRNVSVGYRVHKYEEVEGKNGAPATRTALDWEPYEVSMVPMGADSGAQTRSGADHIDTFPCVLVTRGLEESMEPTNAGQETRTDPVPAPTPAPPAPKPAEASADEIRSAAVKAERERIAAIQTATRGLGFPADVAEEMVRSGLSLDGARAELIERKVKEQAKTPTVSAHPIVAGQDSRDKYVRGVAASIIQRSGLGDLVRQAMKLKPDHPAFKDLSLDPGEFRGLSLLEMARESLEAEGVRTRGLDKLEVAGQALRRGLMRRDLTGAQTTSDFTVALENVLNKVLLAAYTITPDTWRRFCSIGSVTDFRPHPRYRSGFMSRLAVVMEGAEFVNKTIPDAVKESMTATTKGNIVSLSRQAIINDDMSIFSRVAQQLGRAAALSIEMDVYDLLALNAGLGPVMNDGLTLFHATHLNVGTGAAISVASIDADRVVLASQRDPSGNEILDARPKTLLIAIGLGGQARVINGSQYDTDIVANKFLVPNKVQGLFNDIVDTPRLSGTRRYMFTDPAQIPTIEVAFLEGVQEPFLEMQEGWRIDGIEWKERLDYGVAAVDFRGAVTNAGV